MVLTIFLLIAIFVTSDESSFRILSMTPANFATVVILVIVVYRGFRSDKLVIRNNPLLIPSIYFIIWCLISLVAAKFFADKAVPYEAFRYEWATGINSPDIRGFAFAIRLFLSIFLIHYVIEVYSKKEKFIQILQGFITVYGIFCLVPFVQIVLYSLFGIELGKIFVNDATLLFRVGAYVGEPVILAQLLCSGYFLVIGMLNNRTLFLYPRKLLWIIFAVATIDLLFTYSTSIIVGMLVAYVIFARSFLSKRIMFSFLLLILFAVLVSNTLQEVIFLKLIHELSTVNIRSLSWILGIYMFLDNPISGVGIGQSPFFNSVALDNDIDVPFDLGMFYDYSSMRHPPMNSYIEWLAEMGIMGMILFCYAAYKVYQYQKMIPDCYNKRFINFAFGTTLIAMLLSANSSPSAFFLPNFNLIIGLYIAGLTIVYDDTNK